MGNSSNSMMCAECATIQIEDASVDNQRSNFQMTRLRHFSHYSRDFQVEQKYNRIKQNKPNFSLQVEMIYPEYLLDKKNDLILQSGIQDPNKKVDLDAETIKKSFNVGNLKIKTYIKCKTMESLQDECCEGEEGKGLAERASQVDAFMLFIDPGTDFTLLNQIIELIGKICKCEALVFMIAAKQTPTPSFVEAQNTKEQPKQEGEEENGNKQAFQGSPFEINEQKLSKSQMNKSNLFGSFVQSESNGKIQSFQTQVKNIVESSCNTDFICIDYDSVENMNQKLENMLSQCIYSQDSRLRTTV